jgi:hypothetical protein
MREVSLGFVHYRFDYYLLPSDSLLGLLFDPYDEGNIFLRSVGKLLANYPLEIGLYIYVYIKYDILM